MTDARDQVTLCLPAWNCAAFIDETLASIDAQGLRARVLISLDASQDRSAEPLQSWARRRQARLFVQRRRLGWRRNCNFLIAQVDTEYFAIAPHDDRLRPSALARCLAALRQRPDAVCAYGDLQTFGAAGFLVDMASVEGDRADRLEQVIGTRHAALPFRGLVRRASAHDRPLLPGRVPEDYAADTLWMLRLAADGALLRLPEPLYDKRLHAGSTHAAWARWPGERRAAAWLHLCLRLLDVGVRLVDDAAARRRLRVAAAARYRQAGALTGQNDIALLEPGALAPLLACAARGGSSCRYRLRERAAARAYRLAARTCRVP